MITYELSLNLCQKLAKFRTKIFLNHCEEWRGRVSQSKNSTIFEAIFGFRYQFSWNYRDTYRGNRQHLQYSTNYFVDLPLFLSTFLFLHCFSTYLIIFQYLLINLFHDYFITLPLFFRQNENKTRQYSCSQCHSYFEPRSRVNFWQQKSNPEVVSSLPGYSSNNVIKDNSCS